VVKKIVFPRNTMCSFKKKWIPSRGVGGGALFGLWAVCGRGTIYCNIIVEEFTIAIILQYSYALTIIN
jgi:hypothetical protein